MVSLPLPGWEGNVGAWQGGEDFLGFGEVVGGGVEAGGRGRRGRGPFPRRGWAS